MTCIFGISFVQAVFAETIRGIVTKVHPVYGNYTKTTPYQDCYNQQVFVPNNGFSSATPTIAGGIVGGVIGNQFGKGDGKTILTVAGALLGSSIGSDMGNSGNGYTKNVQRCETRYSESVNVRIQGYNIGVTIPNGHVINTYKEMPYNPPPIHSNVDVHVNYRIGNY
tara:strand:- start:3346 stop:3846 length:501 start_codon:yes stop_codon:yes gene_type:complete